jgi:SAM-dependent methyltransferase
METVKGTNKDYADFLNQHYFPYCKDKDILEIGPYGLGFHTKLIQNFGPKSHTAIEGDPEQCEIFESNFPNVNLIKNDALIELNQKQHYDIVVCFGVIYHLHSPLHLLELIVNNCTPNLLFLDCVNAPRNNEVLAIEEDINMEGNRFTAEQWRSIKYNMVVPFDIISRSMKQLGYILVNKSSLAITDNFSKSKSWIGVWERTQ